MVVLPFRTPKEAIALANNTRYGLAASVWSENINVALETAISIKAGEMCVELLVFVKGEVFSNLTFFEGKFLLTSDSSFASL